MAGGYPGAADSDEEEVLFGHANGGDHNNSGRTLGGNGNESSCCDCDEENRPCYMATGCCCLFFLLIFLAMSFDVVKPTEYGIMQNGWSGFVYSDAVDTYSAGRHFLGLRNFFITFPAYRTSFEFSSRDGADAKPVPARTGRDVADPDSGGQPVTLSFSFQYQFKQTDVGKVYKEFGEQYPTRYLLFARMAVSDVAQRYTPDKFWTERPKIAADMYITLRESLRTNGHVDVVDFQLLQVDFPDKYEDMITDIQLQVQYKLTSEYQQQVTNVIKDIDVLTAETAATITAIGAGASATSSILVNKAAADGSVAQQEAKATAYADLQTKLSLTNAEVLEYVKIRALSEGRASKSTVVGMQQPSLVF